MKDQSGQDEHTYLNIINGYGLEEVPRGNTVTIVVVAQRARFDVRILKSSSRVGGRSVTLRDPLFAPGLHAEGGAMRIPRNHFLLHAYLKRFRVDSLLPFEIKNKFIYVSGYRGGTTMTYDSFNKQLVERKTCEKLFFEAIVPLFKLVRRWYEAGDDEPTGIRIAYQKVTEEYDKYSLRSYLEEVAGWSADAIRLYDLGNGHVVFENGFIEFRKDAFLSSNEEGEAAGIQQLQNGMDQVCKAFIAPGRGKLCLAENIAYGARVTRISDILGTGDNPYRIEIAYETASGGKHKHTSNFVTFAMHYGAQRAITKYPSFTPATELAIRNI
ncbi:hypothetical protein F4859DRAFT_507010 [Xylaria cf. heliscus]|nr:hypothetical protein F4859DRAFT_507010 [Xylaria cf. heliscus]